METARGSGAVTAERRGNGGAADAARDGGEAVEKSEQRRKCRGNGRGERAVTADAARDGREVVEKVGETAEKPRKDVGVLGSESGMPCDATKLTVMLHKKRGWALCFWTILHSKTRLLPILC